MDCECYLTEFESLHWDFAETEKTTKKGCWLWKLASARKRLQENYKEAENSSLIFFSTSTVILLDSSIWLMLKLFVFVCFTLVKPKGKEWFRWWTSMRSQNPRMPSLERTKVVVVAVHTGGIGDWIRQIIHTKQFFFFFFYFFYIIFVYKRQ